MARRKTGILLWVMSASILLFAGPVSSQSRTIPRALVDLCAVHKVCGPAAFFVRAHIAKAERDCLATNNLTTKKPLLDQLGYWQRIVDALALGDSYPDLVMGPDAYCGGLLDPEITYIDVVPPEASLKPNEQLQLKATIHCSNGTCLGDVGWWPSSPSVASVDQTGMVTALNPGQTDVNVASRDLEAIRGSAAINVEGAIIADVAFVISTGIEHWGALFPGDSEDSEPPYLADFAAAFHQKANELFSLAQFGVYSYSASPSLCVDTTSCGFPSGSCYAFASHTPYGSLLTEPELVAAFSELRTVCSSTLVFGDPTSYYGTSMYSGLVGAINEFRWRPEAKKAIILIGGIPAGLYWDGSNTGTEPGTNISRASVISLATSKGIRIFTINTQAVGDCWGLSWVDPIVQQELHTLADSTGGKYYPSGTIGGCYPWAPDNVLTALQDLRGMFSSVAK